MKRFITTLFKRNNAVVEYPIKDTGNFWSVSTAKLEGKPMVVRKNNWCNSIMNKAEYNYCNGIAFKYIDFDENGFPTGNESEYINKLEDDLFKICEINNVSKVAVIITFNGVREYVIYSKTEDLVQSIVPELKSRYSRYEITSYTEKDVNWFAFSEYK
ncbi:MAG: DUF695 domain-containing protein [Vallitalea sp.]|jgi:hypothetical protein|nr:DUF695 domain-containing protein [Vallitalea sp.]